MDEISEEISQYIGRMKAAAASAEITLHPPLLMLGTSERVGSNWLSDTLRAVSGQHNEPFRQQLGPDHPLSALNVHVGDLKCAAGRLGPYGRLWLAEFVASKYGPVRQTVKETNLFFALSNLLALFPDAPITVLTRSPLGVASSFARGCLYRRWDYPARYQQMVATTRRIRHARYAPLVPDDQPTDLVALVRLQVLNALLLAEALGDRDILVFPYESALSGQRTALRLLTEALPDLAADLAPPAAPARFGEGDDTFATNRPKTDPVAYLDPAGAELVRSTTAITLKIARDVAPAASAERAACWLAGDHRYLLKSPAAKRRPAARRSTPGSPRSAIGVTYVRHGPVEWRNLLVGNAEFAAFLNALSDAGLDNSHEGTHLLVCPMPHERGGRLHRDPSDGRWTVRPGYDDHPAYWVTWIGAALFALADGGRLPTRTEMIDGSGRDPRATNSDYAHGDVTPITEAGRSGTDIHHLVGNLQVWCSDGPGPNTLLEGPAARWIHGAAWNTPSTAREIHRARHRHLTGSSRGVGIRVVRDRPAAPLRSDALANLARDWLDYLSRPEAQLIRRGATFTHMIGLATASQADVGLGALIGPGLRKPVPDQTGEPLAEPQRGQIVDLHELHAPDGPRVGTGSDLAQDAARPAGFEGDVDDMGAVARQVIADVEQPAGRYLDTGLLAHLPHQRLGQALPGLDLPTGQGPRPACVGVLVEQQDLVVLDDDSGHPNVQHPRKLSQGAAQ